MSKGNRPHGSSIFRRLMAFLLVLLVFQTLVSLFTMIMSGVLTQTRGNAFDIFNERTSNRRIYLENEMVDRWSSLEYSESRLISLLERELAEQNIAPADLRKSQERCQQLVTAAAPEVVEMLRYTGATGAFLVLNSEGNLGGCPGFYVRDYDPGGYVENNADLLVQRGSPILARELNIALDVAWSMTFNLYDNQAPATQFFYQPMEAAAAVPPEQRDSRYFGYWSPVFTLSDRDRRVVTYSIPLLAQDGTVLGVMGVDLTLDYLASQLKYDELVAGKEGAYVIAITRDGGATYEPVCASGPNYALFLEGVSPLVAHATDYGGIVTLEHVQGKGHTLYGSVQPIKLYDNNTPFEGDQWALIGLMEGEKLLAFPDRIQTMNVLALIVSAVVSLILIIFIAHNVTRPITRLVKDLRRSDPSKPIQLGRLNLMEIDELTGAIEELSNTAVASAGRISTILAMTKLPVGVFEYRQSQDMVFCSRRMFEILDWPEQPEGDMYLSVADFKGRMGALYQMEGSRGELIFRLTTVAGDRWVQVFHKTVGGDTLGAFLDVTQDMENKRKIEYERDFDVLTALLNRRAFDVRMENLFLNHQDELGYAVLLMFDLDNLKYVNDTYGHDLGDRYIQAFAQSLEEFSSYTSLISRRSGDEFTVFLYGYSNQNKLREIVNQTWERMSHTQIELPIGGELKVRASGGMAWYPQDTQDYQELLRLADFAMYDIKHTVKGMLQEFDSSDYKSRSIFIQGQNDLNRIIDERLIQYALQPIVSVRDGAIMGYEMLMRPQVERLSSPLDLLAVARAESKLYQIECLTWFAAMETFQRLEREGVLACGCNMFINSIGNQCMTMKDLAALEEAYLPLLSRVVVEITEMDELSDYCMQTKNQRAQRWGAKIALDDYGTGFNSQSALITISPQLVKVDSSIIRNVDMDLNRRVLLRDMVAYAKDRNITTIAEGVETEGELATVVSCGVDYIQGYLVAKPSIVPPTVTRQMKETIRRIWQEHQPT